MIRKTFDIIRFTADIKKYYPASAKNTGWLGRKYVKHTDIEISLGSSRYGGPVVDLPPGIDYPEKLRFAAQLDLSKFSLYDKTDLLPKTGQLLFFADIKKAIVKVFYADVPNESLVRVIYEHEDDFWEGVLISQVIPDFESFDERFRKPEDEREEKLANEQGLVWDYFAGMEKSKIFGIFTNCQMRPEEIKSITFSDKVLLLQIGENGFNEDSVFSVLIPKKDLQNCIFDNCELIWGQS